MKYWNHREESELNEEIIFCAEDKESCEHYGPICRVFDSEKSGAKLDDGTALKIATVFYDVEEEDIKDEVYPDRIVSSAGVWDDIDFINYLYDENYFSSFDAIETGDGAIVFNAKFMEIVK